jgi:hypothetical protein
VRRTAVRGDLLHVAEAQIIIELAEGAVEVNFGGKSLAAGTFFYVALYIS